MHEENLESYLRSKLQNHQVPFEESDWDLMQDRLDAAFDAQVQGTLANHEVPFLPQDWYQMAESLYGPFDASVEQALDEHQELGAQEDWPQLAEHLDAPLYSTIRTKLAQHSVEAPPADWKVMEAQLDAVYPTTVSPTRSFLYRMSAVAAVLLLFFWVKHVPDLTFGGELSPAINQNTPSSNVLTPTNQDIIASREESGNDIAASPNSNGPNSSMPKVGEKGASIPTNDAGAGEVGLTSETSLSVQHILTPPEMHWEEVNVPDHINPITSYLIPSISTEIEWDAVDLTPPTQALESLESQDDKPSFQPDLYIGLVAGNASSVAELNDAGKMGGFGGIGLEVSLNPSFSFVTGIQYAEKRYNHTFFKNNTAPNFFGPVDQLEHAISANFRMIEVPMMLRYKLPPEGPVTLYVQAGVVPMVTLEETFQHYDPDNVVNVSNSNPNSLVPQDPFDLTPTPHKRNFNTYIGNVKTSIGAYYQLSDRLNLQIEPYFQLGLQRMGIEEKRLYSMGIGMSVFYDLKQKKVKKA